jgi:hypothetical protein
LPNLAAQLATPVDDPSSPAATPTIAVIETLREARPPSIRIARALARPQSDHVLLCHWHGLDFSEGTVLLRGEFYSVTKDGKFEACRPNENRRVTALFFDGPEAGSLETHDASALQKLCAAGIDAHAVPLHIVVDRLMLEASRRGVITNALGTSRAWGPKHNQELKLRRYEKRTGQTVTRPKTYIARPHELQQVLSLFAARSEISLIKPVFGEGGSGFHIVRPGESFPRFEGTVVVQRLIPNPLLLQGHKADLRFYLLIDVHNRQLSKRLRPIFFRRAAVPYVAGSEAAEITNTAYRIRQGLLPDVRPLAPSPDICRNTCEEITSQVDSLANRLLDGYFWDLADAHDLQALIPNRRILFGIDALVAVPRGATPFLYFLETNPFPAFFRGVAACDGAVEEMFSTEYLPALTRSSHP